MMWSMVLLSRQAGSAGAALLGVARWRAGTLPRWTGPLYAVAIPLISIVGLAVGMAQPVGATMIVISGAWIASTSPPNEPAG
jgi:hypothetical protein